MGKLDGKVAIIAYAGGGIGKATAELFANEGAKVFVHDDAAEKLEGVPGEKIVGDLRKQEDADKLIQTVLEKGGGKIDILVNNEDFVGTKKKIIELTTEEFNEVIDMNLKTIWHTLAAIYPTVKSQTAIRIINIGNVAGSAGASKLAAYSSAKAGLYGLTKTMAKEWARFPGVRVNAINVGVIKFKGDYAKQGGVKASIKDIGMANPFAGVANNPQDVAAVALLLASESGAIFNAEILNAVGGIYTISGE